MRRKIFTSLWMSALFCGVIVLLISLVATPFGIGAGKRLSQTRVHDLDQGLARFLLDTGRCPSAAADLVAQGYVYRQALQDAWGTAIAYSCSNAGARVRSAGPDKVFDTRDDITTIQ
jgi:hypothetical protein